MVVDARGKGNRVEHGGDNIGDFGWRHAGTKLLNFGFFVGYRFHGEMKHDLVAAMVGGFGDFCGTRVIGKDREGQRVVERENSVDRSRIAANVVENNGEARSGNSGMRRMRGGGVRLGSLMVGMKKRVKFRFDFAAAGK